MLAYCPNCSRDLFFANRRRFAKFTKMRSSRKFSSLQYIPSYTHSHRVTSYENKQVYSLFISTPCDTTPL
ncbi:MAG: hypothetical protein PV344_03915, partial [Anaplasma sp.]|nr:hypothetical protein [Anaplasma sp.]